MAFNEDFITPRMVSYLDLYIFAGKQGHLSKATMQKCSSYSKDVLLGLPMLDYKVILPCLWEMGVDTTKEVEENFCFHKPICMSVQSRNEDKPKLFGLIFQGQERTDKEWLKEKANFK